ncbi:MAG: bifunctional 4-hydroxy-2-oxoglutarate aldolase/2-dehydro-3-deoxy-phosphogluconate aldolase [Clostridia bacterium]|nr:bifunctional 4-hydroxy-2-oxoglutarate aldolase/2-dehydro-3-deoxy-phosphogluconate aldolase [Clostridia bacterium]
MRGNVIKAVENEKIIVILRGIESKKIIPLAEAMYAGGIRLLEVTYDATSKIPHEETAADIKALKEHFGDRMCIGAGTVLTEKQVELTKAAGGEFIISPDANESVIKKTVELGLVSIPGALTPTEIQAAHRAGADFVKLFPIVSMGPSYVKAVKAPLSNIKLLAVGGVDLDNISEYFAAGICGIGLASNITDKKLIAEENFEGITELAKKYVSAVRGASNG